jgi:hypothetical protein
MNRTAEVHHLPLKDAAPTPGERRRLWVGWLSLMAGAWCVCLVLFGSIDAWAREVPDRDNLLAYIVCGALFLALGGGLLYGWDWVKGEPTAKRCEDCGEGMHLVGDVWVCWHCAPVDGV